MLPFNLDFVSVVSGIVFAYAIYSFITLIKAIYDKKKAEKELVQIESKLKKVQDDLVEKKKRLEKQLKEEFNIK